MKDYEDRKYEQWKEATEQMLPTLMRKSLLTKVCVFTSLSRSWWLGKVIAIVIFLRFGLLTLMRLVGIYKTKGKEGEEAERGDGDSLTSRLENRPELDIPTDSLAKWLNSKPQFLHL